MAPSISFVIPVLNEGENIASLLADLAVRYPAAERIVVDGGSVDDTLARASQATKLLHSSPGRARQMNCGAEEASGDYLFFLHADTRPTIDADSLAMQLQPLPAWGFSRVRLDGQSMALRTISFFMNWRSRLTRVATGDQMLFLQRELFAATGGFDDIPLMEDVAYCKRLRREAPPLVLAEPVTTSSRRWRERGVVRTVLQMWWLRLAYFLGASPTRLWQQYYGRG